MRWQQYYFNGHAKTCEVKSKSRVNKEAYEPVPSIVTKKLILSQWYLVHMLLNFKQLPEILFALQIFPF